MFEIIPNETEDIIKKEKKLCNVFELKSASLDLLAGVI